MITLLSNVSFRDAISNIDVTEFYTLTYLGLGIIVLVIIVNLFSINSAQGRNGIIACIIILTIIVVGAVEIYHSRYRLEKRIAENEAQEFREKQRNIDEKRRQEGCTFEYAKKKADAFMESTGFIIVQSNQPYYSAIPYEKSFGVSCSADFSYVVKVREYNPITEQTSVNNRLHIVSLSLERFLENFKYSYEFTSATIEDQTTKKTINLLK